MIFLVEDHPILGGEPPNTLHKQGASFWREMRLSSCDKAYIFVVDGQIVGFTRYNQVGNYLHYEGTWVHSKYRGMGYAKQMWNLSIETSKPSTISVATTSDDGWYLVKSLEKQWNNIKFKISDQR